MASQEVLVRICFISVAKCVGHQKMSVPNPDQTAVRYRCGIIPDVKKDTQCSLDDRKVKRAEVYARAQGEGRYHVQGMMRQGWYKQICFCSMSRRDKWMYA